MGDLFAGGVELLTSLFSSAGDAAAGLGTAAADVGAGAAGGGIADIVGTGAGLAGGATGLEGTLASAGGLGLADAAGAGGLGALGTAADFLAAPAASGLSAAALTPGISGAAADTALTSAADTGLASGVSGITGTPSISSLAGDPSAFPGVSSSSLSPNVANANAAAPGSSVFNTGTAPVAGVNPAGTPSVNPGGASAAGVSAPSGVTAPTDATAAGVPGNGAGGGSPTGTPAGGSTSISDMLSNAGSKTMDSLTNNPLGVALGAGGLGYNIFKGQQQTANQNALSADAAQATANSNKLTASGTDLQKYMTDGTLPPNYQKIVDQSIQDAKTTAISNAAQQGLPTDPTQNTALAATLAKIDASRPGMQAQVAQTLFSSGSSLVSAGQSAAGLSGNLYQTLVQNDTAQAANTGKAIATLASALNGKSSANINGTNVTIG
jgi:hypothetical protein